MSTEWKPKLWVALLLTFFLNPFAFLYLNRGKLFWLYVPIIIGVGIADHVYGYPLFLILVLLTAIHVFLIHRNFTEPTERRWYSKPKVLVAIPASYFIVIFLVRSFLYEPFTMPGNAMQPTLEQGNMIVVTKQGFGSYGSFGISLYDSSVKSPELMQRGKLYVFYPPHQDVPFVKRLIALPGDRVAMVNNTLMINDVTIANDIIGESDEYTVYEQILDDVTYRFQRSKRPRNYPSQYSSVIVPQNSYFFVGDNRDLSSDSRFWGFVSGEDIIGEVVYVID